MISAFGKLPFVLLVEGLALMLMAADWDGSC